MRLTGAADHRVSEAVYLDDPEGNGIEIYRDRERASWLVEGRIVMGNTPLDFQGILAAGQEAGPADAMPAGTVLGHVHLETHDLQATRDFYVGRLGFDLIVGWPKALFMSVGGYHHHLGANIWGGRSRPRGAGERLLGLRHYTMLLPGADAVARLGETLGVPVDADGSIHVTDPSGIGIAWPPSSVCGQGLRPDLGQRGTRGQGFGVDPDLDQSRALLSLRLGEGGGEICGPVDRFADPP